MSPKSRAHLAWVVIVSVVSLYAYVNPRLAVTLVTVFLGERFTWWIAAAGTLIHTATAIVREAS